MYDYLVYRLKIREKDPYNDSSDPVKAYKFQCK